MTPKTSNAVSKILLAVAVALPSIASAEPARANAEPARAPAPAPAPYFVKSAASLADLEKTLQGKGAHSGDLLKPGATALEIVWRHEEDYEQKEVELHDGKDHVFFVTEGQATFTLGGQMVGQREVSPGEWKAGTAANAQQVEVGKGDLIFIPHGTVHSRSAKGRRFTMLQLSFWPGGVPAPKVAAPAAGTPALIPAAVTPPVSPAPAPSSAPAVQAPVQAPPPRAVPLAPAPSKK